MNPSNDGDAPGQPSDLKLGEVGEAAVLATILEHAYLADAEIGPGDDAAVMRPSGGRTVATTDSMVRGLDWRDDFSTGFEVGVKVIAQNLADVEAMGARCTGVLVALAADPETPLGWVSELADGMADELRRYGTGILGGDLSGAPAGCVIITVTALGDLVEGEEPFLRSAACPGDAVIVSGVLGRSHAGLLHLLREAHAAGPDPKKIEECVRWHCAPRPQWVRTAARAAGIRCAMDVSDGLGLDAARMARASGVAIRFEREALEAMAAPLKGVVSEEQALECVMAGGEEHALLATCPPENTPEGWYVIGQVIEGEGLFMGEEPLTPRGWSHYLN